jgi:hypothetical protein
MKKLLLLLLFIPLVSFGQTDQWGETKVETNVNNVTRVARPLVLSDASTTVRVTLADLSSYTDILIVKAVLMNKDSKYNNLCFSCDRAISNKKTYKEIQDVLSMSLFEVKNPHEVKSSRARKEPEFLKTIKETAYLYLYYSESSGRGDDINTIVIVRDFNNKILYAANHINVGIDEALSPIMF